ncbi:high-affinity choline transporter 1-like isoform X2 [Dermacentor albipictus]|uniref:high-affinity choline transporter 1-like isoform X2 n=1 Tax=Dermacentor albipictus TaxID=60249 RepID=UPI0031FCCDAE
MAINVPGLVAIVFFYLIILVVGIWAGRKNDAPRRSTLSMSMGEQSNIMLAGRNIGLFIGVFTMTATWVGGGYINGTAEVVYLSGLAWCQAPFGYAISLLIGATVEVIMDFERTESVVASACIALFYTFTGGLYSVAYTDVIQLLAIFFGLWLSVPFAMFHEAVGPISYPRNDFVGSVEWKDFGTYWDNMLLLMMGGVPWQVYFQRVLSSRTAEGAELLSYMAAFGCLFMAIPPVIIGAVAKAANFTQVGYTKAVPLTGDATSLTLPLVLQYLTPGFVSAMGLGAVSAAVMSSSDSSILSAASMFAWNIYKLGIRQNATEKEVIYVMRVSIVLVGALATFMALTAESIYSLWYLSSDLVYVILFPQLVCVVYLKDHVNTYGSFAAYVVGCFLRAGGGERILKIPPFIKYPFYDYEQGEQRFPFRTLSMVISFLTLVAVSGITSWLFTGGRVPLDWDVFNCFQPDAKVLDKVPLVEGADLKAPAAVGPPPAAPEPVLTPATAETSAIPGSSASASTTPRDAAGITPHSTSEYKLSPVEKIPSRISQHSAEMTLKSPGTPAKGDVSKDASETSASKRKKHGRSSQESSKLAQSDTPQTPQP